MVSKQKADAVDDGYLVRAFWADIDPNDIYKVSIFRAHDSLPIEFDVNLSLYEFITLLLCKPTLSASFKERLIEQKAKIEEYLRRRVSITAAVELHRGQTTIFE